MARRGRPGKGLEHIDGLEGGEVAKGRQKAILQTLLGELTLSEASRRLGLSEARVRTLRSEALQSMLDSLEPRPPGRPPKEAEPLETANDLGLPLKRRVRELEFDLQVARTRTELALTMPHVLRDVPEPEAEEGGGPKRTKRGDKPRWFKDTTNGT